MHVDNSLKWTSRCSNKGVTLISPPPAHLYAYLWMLIWHLWMLISHLCMLISDSHSLWMLISHLCTWALKCGHICCWSHLRVYNWSSEKSSQMLRIWQFAICAIFDKTGRQLWKLHNCPLNLEWIFATPLCTHWNHLKLLKKLHRTHWDQLKLLKKNCTELNETS